MTSPVYLQIARRRWRAVVIVTLLATAVALVGALLLPTRYRAEATVRVATTGGLPASVGFDDATYGNRVLNTYRLLVGSDAFRQELAAGLQTPRAPDVQAAVPPNSELLQLSVESGDPASAERAANAAAELLVRQVHEQAARTDTAGQESLESRLESLSGELARARQALQSATRGTALYETESDRVRALGAAYAALLQRATEAGDTNALRASGTAIVSRALRPSAPSGPSRALVVGLGVLCGLVAGIGLAFALHRLDRRLYAPQAIGAAAGDDALLATIPAPNGNHAAASAAADHAFLRLVAVLAARRPLGLRSVLVAGAGPVDDTWPVAERLGQGLAVDGRRVVVVDANLHDAAPTDGAAGATRPGLREVLAGEAGLPDALRPAAAGGVCTVPAGSAAADAGALLSSPATHDLLRDLGERFDIVVVHAAPLPAFADATLLAPGLDGVVLVARAGGVTADAIAEACDELDAVHANRLGVVVMPAGAPIGAVRGNGAARR